MKNEIAEYEVVRTTLDKHLLILHYCRMSVEFREIQTGGTFIAIQPDIGYLQRDTARQMKRAERSSQAEDRYRDTARHKIHTERYS